MKNSEKQPTNHHPEPKPNQKPLSDHGWCSLPGLWQRKSMVIAAFSIVTIISYLWLRFGLHATSQTYEIPLLATLTGAVTQEVIDVLAVLNALRAAFPPKVISDL